MEQSRVPTYKKQLVSGANLEIWLAEFEDGWALFKAVLKELQSLEGELNTENPLVSLRLLSSDFVEQALKPCMSKATYQGQRIDKTTFNSPEARCDYLEVVKEVMNYNIAPFSKNVGLMSKGI